MIDAGNVLLSRGYVCGPSEGPGVHAVLMHGQIVEWRHPTDPQPAAEQLATWAASPEYAEWYRTHGGDPDATLARETAERIASPSTPTERGVECSLVALITATLNPLIARVNTLSAAASPSMLPLDLIDPEAARQYAAALALGQIQPSPPE